MTEQVAEKTAGTTEAAAAEANKSTEAKATEAKAFAAPTSQEELDRIISGAVGRAHAKYADYDDLKAKASKLAEIETANQTEAEKAAARAEAAETRAIELTARTVRAEAKALASDTFADPDDAHLYVDVSKFTDEDGVVDTEALKAALADVLTRKPHLAKQPGKPRGDVGQGTRANGTPTLDAQIAEATAAGNHRLAIALKQQQRVAAST